MTNNINIHFEVAIEGLCQKFKDFNEARDEYYALKDCGFYCAVFRKVADDNKQTADWNDRACCFIG